MPIIDDYAAIAAGVARLRRERGSLPAQSAKKVERADSDLPPRQFLISEDGRIRILPRQPAPAVRRR